MGVKTWVTLFQCPYCSLGLEPGQCPNPSNLREERSACPQFSPSGIGNCYDCMHRNLQGAETPEMSAQGHVYCNYHRSEVNPDDNRYCRHLGKKYTHEKKEGGCFITTATCDILGRPDDCRELQELRRFRADHLVGRHDELLEQYRELSATIVPALQADPNNTVVSFTVMAQLQCIIAMIHQGLYDAAIASYREMVLWLQGKYTAPGGTA